MLTKIIFLTTFLFSIIYPLCFLISASDPLKNKFHQFHLGLPNTVGGILVFFALFMSFPDWLKLSMGGWIISSLLAAFWQWKKESPNPVIITLPSIGGLIIFPLLHQYWIGGDFNWVVSWLLGGFILSSTLYAMNLGHWYLNVHGLPIIHLRRATQVFAVCLMVRLLWDIFILLTQSVNYRGDEISIISFLFKMDGFLLIMAFFFGVIFPLISTFFALETIKLKNTQSTTGILYAILCSVLIGDFAYKYYLLRFGLPL